MNLSDQLVKGVFDNVRNFILSSAVIAAGILIARNASESRTTEYEYIIGGLSILLGLGLFSLNAVHGWKKLTELELSKTGLICLQFLYGLVFIEIVKVLWQVRIGL